MLKFRQIKTGSGKVAVQVYYLHNRKRVILKHVGSAASEDELDVLKIKAERFIRDYSNQASLFASHNSDAFSDLQQQRRFQ